MNSGKDLPERFALNACSPHLQKEDAGDTSGMERQSCRSKLTGRSVERTRRGCRIACDGEGGAHWITDDGREEESGEDTAADSVTPCTGGACAEDGTCRSDSDSCSFTDGNPTQAGGLIAMDSEGRLSLQPHDGAVFNKIIDGKYFYLQNDTYTELFLALSKDERFSVKGMSKQDMRDESDSRWKFHFFKDIGGNSPHDPGDIVLQYYGDRFGPDPDQSPYYLVIELTQDRVPVFRIASKKVAKYCGRLGVMPR
ncbi:hypothetical protein GBAR_LOCUS20769 [Geodia barretti]|uniref:Uncharacterized protein n=1 Tax=Geodia barretti TaxID=519541 RepID=A0AA35SXD0_GEOBA|nr:hypothetical protein GBAR_LOCUS20769 [Geodia barretti]